MKIPLTGPRLAGIGLLFAALAPNGAAQAFDAQIGFIEVTQAMPNTSLTAGRSTFVRAEPLLSSPPSNPVLLDGIMRVFVNGVETADSPVYSDNGPCEATTSPNYNISKNTLNFVYLPPVSNNVVFTIELNPAGPNFVPEGNTANNSKSTPVMDFQVREVPDFAYVPIDYRPGGGGTPNLPPEDLIEPGVGDNFIQGIYPAKDIYYHRIDAASKLWTGDLSSSGSALLNSMASQYNLLSPKPDFFYGWVPGPLPGYNGQAFINGTVAMGNTEQVRHQRTYAHEVGHNTGLNHTSWLILERGADTEHHLNLTEGLSVIKKDTLNNIMDPGLLTKEAWVRDTHYEHFFNHPAFAPPAPGLTFQGPGLFVAGLWHAATGELSVDHVHHVPSGVPTPTVGKAQADFELSLYRGAGLAHHAYLWSGTTTDCDSGSDSNEPPPELAFYAVVPTQEPFDRLVITPMGRAHGEPLILDRSAHVPEIEFLAPGPGGDVSAGEITVAWKGHDADGDDLRYYLRYTNDGTSFAPLAIAITETKWRVDLSELPAFDDGVGYFELFASDGLNTTVLQSPKLHGSGGIWAAGSNPPWVHVSTPDDGKDFPRAATVILHAQGWDLEDDGLDDSQMVWTSDLDGQIAIGRLTSVTGLSVGTHVLTVTGTDDDLLTATYTTTIVITDRGLPGDPTGPFTYCTAGTSASGCQALLSTTGTPSASAPSGFTVTASTVEGSKDGLFFYGTNGPQANPWGNGTSYQCVVPPTIRTPTLNSGGTVGACDGTMSRDMNAYWTAFPIKNPGAGATVDLQLWYRDPANTSNQTTSLSNAVEFVTEP